MAKAFHSTVFKTCSVCGEEKPATVEFFHPNKGGKYGLRGQCRPCRKAAVREQIKEPANAERRKLYQADYIASGRNAERSRSWRRANPQSALASKRKWMAANTEHIRRQQQEWRDQNREKVRAKQRRADGKLRQSPGHVLKQRVKKRLRMMLTGEAIGGRTEALLGYSREDLVRHIERQFTKGMTWEALLRGEIHIDHIIPVSAFEITSSDSPDFKACWALSNLRPLWASDNFKKQAKILTLL